MRYDFTRSDALTSNGQWNSLYPVNGVDPSTLKILANVWNKLTSVDGDIVLLSNSIVIPDALQKCVIGQAHEGHHGLFKTWSFFYIQNREPIKDSDVQVGDTVLVKEPKLDKFCTPYHPVPLTVTSKNHSMLTAEGGDRKVTRNYFCFKKRLLDTRFPLSVVFWKKRQVTKMFHTHSYILYHLVKTMLTQHQMTPTQ